MRHVARASQRRVEADERECECDDADRKRDRTTRSESEAAQSKREEGERSGVYDKPAAVSAGAAPPDRHEHEQPECDEPAESVSRRGHDRQGDRKSTSTNSN